MLNLIFFLTSAWLTIHASITSAQTPPCIGDLLDLFDIQTARGTNVAAPVTYILCPNTVYDPSVIPFFLNGNANYLCGGDGSSSNNCILRGGFNQIVISTFDFDFAVKDKILVSGFTFEQSEFVNVVGASPGRLKFRDCIFQNNVNVGVVALLFYDPPTLRRDLLSASSSWKNHGEDHDLIRFLTKPRAGEYEEMTKRSLLIGGGSEPRNTVSFENCQFINNARTETSPIVSSLNGVFSVLSEFVDVTISDSLFEDNNYPFIYDGPTSGYLAYVEASATLTLENSCFVDNFIGGKAPIWVKAASGLIDSRTNYLSDNVGSPAACDFMFNQEQYKCFAPESSTCAIRDCAASYKVFNAATDTFVANIVNGGTITNPPCRINIEAILPCAPPGTVALMELLQNGVVVRKKTERGRFFLFGNPDNNISSGTIASGMYTIQTTINGFLVPPAVTFTLAGTCVN